MKTEHDKLIESVKVTSEAFVKLGEALIKHEIKLMEVTALQNVSNVWPKKNISQRIRATLQKIHAKLTQWAAANAYVRSR